MPALVFLLFLIVLAFGELDINSKTRNFSFELLYRAVQDSNRDVMISPYAIWYLLIGVAYETLGVTREQFAKVFPLTEERSEVVGELMKQRTSVLVNVTFENFFFYDESLNVYSGSIERLENDFSFVTRRLRFVEPQNAFDSAVQTLREYHVSPSLLIMTEDFVNSTVIMCNYFFLDVEWSKSFDIWDTVQGYYRDGSTERALNVMHLKARLRFSDLESLHASVTELPYKGDRYCMLLLRPHKGYDVKQVLRNLREISLKDVFAKLQSDVDEFGLREVEVKLPRTGIHLRVVLNEPLINMGLSDAFDQNSANFDSLTETKIYIGEISHRVTLIMTESKTMVVTNTPAHPFGKLIPTNVVPVKDPFIFFIMEKSTVTILLGGVYSKVALN